MGAGASNGGGYTSGILKTLSPLVLYGYLGGQEMPSGVYAGIGGYNGGGNSTKVGIYAGYYRGAGGSGATDIRLTQDDLTSRIMVAGGAGGGHSCSFICDGGHGGGLNGGNGYSYENTYVEEMVGKGGSQFEGGVGKTKGELGIGGGSAPGERTDCAGSGGGGYYGGGSGFDAEYAGSGGGGSSYISGYDGCEKHPSMITFKKPNMIPGNESVPNPNGTNFTHYIGQGVIRITQLNCICSCYQSFDFLAFLVLSFTNIQFS